MLKSHIVRPTKVREIQIIYYILLTYSLQISIQPLGVGIKPTASALFNLSTPFTILTGSLFISKNELSVALASNPVPVVSAPLVPATPEVVAAALVDWRDLRCSDSERTSPK
jgi:hypothetical protein